MIFDQVAVAAMAIQHITNEKKRFGRPFVGELIEAENYLIRACQQIDQYLESCEQIGKSTE